MHGTYSNIKVCATKVTPSVSRLHDHFLPLEDGARKGKLVASTTLRAAPANSCKAIGEVGIDRPRCLIAAHIGSSPLPARYGLEVFQGFVRGVTAHDR